MTRVAPGGARLAQRPPASTVGPAAASAPRPAQRSSAGGASRAWRRGPRGEEVAGAEVSGAGQHALPTTKRTTDLGLIGHCAGGIEDVLELLDLGSQLDDLGRAGRRRLLGAARREQAGQWSASTARGSSGGGRKERTSAPHSAGGRAALRGARQARRGAGRRPRADQSPARAPSPGRPARARPRSPASAWPGAGGPPRSTPCQSRPERR